jgi:ATP-dependent Clp protease ATP-binding subunit ClpC
MEDLRFTERAIIALGLACIERWRAGNGGSGSESLLLGVILEGGGLGAVMLQNDGVDAATVRQELSKRPPAASVDQIVPELSLNELIEAAVGEAKTINDAHVGTEHLLLCLLHEGGTPRVLTKLGLDLQRLRQDILMASGHE